MKGGDKMVEKLNAKRVALSLAIVSGVISIICALLILIAPEFTVSLFGAIFHGIDISQITKPITLGGAILGTVEIVILALIAGWLFASVYNKIR
mgnify:CR=1 FL=1